jgi:S1-C subfamily serine protease
MVMDVKPNSPVKGKSGLVIGDIIYEINGCNVTSRSTWRSCIIENINPHTNNEKVIFEYL